MILTDSDSDSSEDDIVKLIPGFPSDDSANRKKQKRIEPPAKFDLLGDYSSSDLIDINETVVDQITVNGQLNNQIVLQFRSLNEKISNYEIEKSSQYNQLENWKRLYLSELNDNGGDKRFDKSKLLEKLVIAEKWEVSQDLVRQFYFWNVKSGVGFENDLSAKENVEGIRAQEIGNYITGFQTGSDVTGDNLGSSITNKYISLSHSFTLLPSLDTARYIDCPQFIDSMIKSDNLQYLSQIEQKLKQIDKIDQPIDLGQCIQMLGGDISLLTSNQPMRLKLYHVCPSINQILIKLTIIIQYTMKANQFEMNLLQIYHLFIYTLCDYNINKFGYRRLLQFIKGNFPYMTDTVIFYDIFSKLETVDYNCSTSQVNYQYQYHIIKLIHQIYPESRQTKYIISRFLFNKPSYTNHDINHLLRTIEFIEPIDTEQIYHNHYKILTLVLILKPFHNHENATPDISNYSQPIIQQNYQRLIQLQLKINRLKLNYESGYRKCLNLNLDKNTISIIGKSYETLANLLNKLESDLSLINDDYYTTTPA